METVLVGSEISLSSVAWIGFSWWGAAIFAIGAVLVDMNFGGSSTLDAAGFRLSRIEGGATGLGILPGAAGDMSDAPEAGISGFSLMVFLAAEEAEAEFGDAGIRFRAEVSVLRIFSGSITPPPGLLSVSAIFISLKEFSASIWLLIHHIMSENIA